MALANCGSSLIHWACETRRTAIIPLLQQRAVSLYMGSEVCFLQREAVWAKCLMNVCPWKIILRLFICFNSLEKELILYMISRVQMSNSHAYLTCPAQVYQKQIPRSVHTEICHFFWAANARRSWVPAVPGSWCSKHCLQRNAHSLTLWKKQQNHLPWISGSLNAKICSWNAMIFAT